VYDHDASVFNFLWSEKANAGFLAIVAGGFLLASWMLGTFLDTLRNVFVEHPLDLFRAIIRLLTPNRPRG
jgi:hypothetical protein